MAHIERNVVYTFVDSVSIGAACADSMSFGSMDSTWIALRVGLLYRVAHRGKQREAT
jgi:hypothetical protein